MMKVPVLLFGVLLALSGTTAMAALAQGKDEAPLTPHLEEDTGYIIWQDIEGEASYRVSGSVGYYPGPSCSLPRNVTGETLEIAGDLPADARAYKLPLPQNASLTWRKDLRFTIEALDAGGQVIAMNGFGYTADPSCSAVELAAAGGGPNGGANAWRLPAALAAFGTLVLASGVALRKAT